MQTCLKHPGMVTQPVRDDSKKLSLEEFSFRGPSWAIWCNTEYVYARTLPDLKWNKYSWLYDSFSPVNAHSCSNVLNIPWFSDSSPSSLLSTKSAPFVMVPEVFDPCQMHTIFQTHDWISHLVSSFLNYTNQSHSSSFTFGFFFPPHFNFSSHTYLTKGYL